MRNCEMSVGSVFDGFSTACYFVTAAILQLPLKGKIIR